MRSPRCVSAETCSFTQSSRSSFSWRPSSAGSADFGVSGILRSPVEAEPPVYAPPPGAEGSASDCCTVGGAAVRTPFEHVRGRVVEDALGDALCRVVPLELLHLVSARAQEGDRVRREPVALVEDVIGEPLVMETPG